MIMIVKSSATLALACGLLLPGCALDVGAGETAAQTTQPLSGHRTRYQLVRVTEYRGESTTASGSARWYMPSVIEDQDGDGENDLLLGRHAARRAARGQHDQPV
jgi:hypothetical protein